MVTTTKLYSGHYKLWSPLCSAVHLNSPPFVFERRNQFTCGLLWGWEGAFSLLQRMQSVMAGVMYV